MPEPALHSNIGLYRSGVTSAERLRHTSVARQHLLDNAIESLRGSVGRKSKNHLLFIGPRGIGKTHLLSCIEDVVQSDEALGASVVVVRFPEESNRTLSFADFLIGMCGILKDVLEDEPLWTELFAKVQTEEDNARVADTLVPAIREENRRRGRTLLVMLENLGEVLGRQIRDKNDVAALRKFLMADNGCLLLATAPLHFDGITDIGQPFYDFFDIQILENLSFEETVEVIRLNLEWEERKDILDTLDDMRPRLQALYRMTGGNPRLTMMLYELIAHESITSVQEQFHLLLDRISPFYQGRLNDLPPGQRALLECLASMRDQEKTPAAIAARMRMSQQETSSLLKRLSDAHYLRADRHPRDRRSRLYTIREGFFDIWLAMNLSRGARKRVPFLLDFFSLFYPSIEARDEKRRQLRAKFLEEGSVDAESALDYLSEVGDAGERATAKFDMARIFARRGDAERTAFYVREAAPLARDGMSQSIARIVASTVSAPDYLSEVEEMIAAWELHRSGELEAFAHRLSEIGEGLTLRTFSETSLAFLRDTLESLGNSEARILQRLRVAAVLMDLARWKESEEQQRLALAEATALANAMLVALASNDLANLLYRTNRLGRVRAADAACIGDRRNHLRQATPEGGESHEQPGTDAKEHRPDRGSRAADAACAGDRRGRLRRAAPHRGERFEQPGFSAAGHQPDRRCRAADAACAGDRRGRLRRRAPYRGDGFEQPGDSSARYQPGRGSPTADAACTGDQHGCLRRATPDGSNQFGQFGADASGHQPDRGSRAADAAGAGDRRGRFRQPTPNGGASFEQRGDSAQRHQPDRGSRAADAAISRHLRCLWSADRARALILPTRE